MISSTPSYCSVSRQGSELFGEPDFSADGESADGSVGDGCIVRMYYGPEFTRKALNVWAYDRSVELHFVTPGKPTQNALLEAFNGRLRDECLNENWFTDWVQHTPGPILRYTTVADNGSGLALTQNGTVRPGRGRRSRQLEAFSTITLEPFGVVIEVVSRGYAVEECPFELP